MKSSFFILISLFYSFAFSQINADTFSINSINYNYVEKLFLLKLNDHRKSIKLRTLQTDSILKLAAKNQANYCETKKELTHSQVTPSLKEPKDRVHHYKGTHATIGENILSVSLTNPILENGKPVLLNKYSLLADYLFKSWKNSPPHYKNMIYSDFITSGLGFKYDNQKGILYVAQVLGSMPFVPIKNGLIYDNNNFGITDAPDNYCNYEEKYEYLPVSLANYLVIENNSIYLYYRELDYVKKIIQNDSDGFAIDIISKEQFNCAGNDNLNGSPIFDGKLLKPVYKKELFSKNEYASRKEFYTKLSDLPVDLNLEKIQFNLITIKDKKLCGYSYPVDVENGLIKSIDILPLWSYTDGKIIRDTININKKLAIPFNRNEVQFDWEELQIQLQKALSIYINVLDTVLISSYSSIEGSEQNNILLQNERATKIKESLNSFLPQKIIIKTEASENWDLFFKQIKNTSYETIFKNKSKEEIRKYINQNKNNITIKKWLNEQRKSIVNIRTTQYIYDSMPPELLHFGLYNAILKKNDKQVNIISSKMAIAYKNKKINEQYIIPTKVPLEKKYLPAINNYISAKILANLQVKINDYTVFFEDDYENIRTYIDSAFLLFKDNESIKFNYIIDQIYQANQTYNYDVNKYIALENQILEFKKSKNIDTNIINSVLYNYYLEGSVLFYQNHKFDYMDEYLDKIKPFLKLDQLSIDQVYDIGKYFNYFYNFYVTQDLLEKYLQKYPNDKKLLYLYVNTGAFINLNHNYKLPYYYQQIIQLIKNDKPKFCEWINTNFQLFRNDILKARFCQNCTLTK